MLDLAYGDNRNPMATEALVSSLQAAGTSGSLYIGYPVLSSVEGTIFVDAMLVSDSFGVLAFDLSGPAGPVGDEDWLSEHEERQAEMYVALKNKLEEFKPLRQGKRLAFDVHVAAFLPAYDGDHQPAEDILILSPTNIQAAIAQFEEIDPQYLPALNAAVQRTTTIKPRKKRLSVKNPESKGSRLKIIEKEIANLDAWQKKAAIECPDGPQRIRGLAGSGKTIVLALKAAYLHARNPEWKIAVTFHTRSLYQQFRDIVRRFTFEHLRDEPDWSKLVVMHSWGSRSEPGMYSEIAKAFGAIPRDFASAKNSFGSSNAFDGSCTELLKVMAGKKIEPLFDAVLIDEAQDFPESFFNMIYEVCTKEKRIIWAYDELQNLGDFSMQPAEKLFGQRNGAPRVELRNIEGQPKQDIILPVCYRNTPWSLTVAHGLGFGIHRDGGLVQMFDDKMLWEQIGYEKISGSFAPGSKIVLQRRADSYPAYFRDLLSPDESVQFHRFDNEDAQLQWVVSSIKHEIEHEELEPTDVLIILPDALTARKKAGRVMGALNQIGFKSHLAGVTTSRDILFADDSIAISGIYRAKGNEAPLVYLLNAEYCHGGFELATKRNILFTAITRSRAWARVCGVGPVMGALEAEYRRIVQDNYRLDFNYPTQQEIDKMRKLHRDMTADEKEKLKLELETLESVVDKLEQGELDFGTLPEQLQAKLRKLKG